MWKVLVADDESKIRRGLISAVDWQTYDMEVVCEAEDGEIALDMIRVHRPDILLLDICMPFVDGLELIEKAEALVQDCKIIVITGHDEFAYAQKALKLKVFDYILKPVSKEQLLSVVIKAGLELGEARKKNKYFNWANHQLERNMPYIKEQFLNDWMNGHLSTIEIEEQINFLGLELGDKPGMLAIKVIERVSRNDSLSERDRYLMRCIVQNISEELLQKEEPNIVFRDTKGNVIILTSTNALPHWDDLGPLIEKKVEQILSQGVIVSQARIKEGIFSVPQTYERLLEDINKKSCGTPIVLRIKKMIEANYHKEDFSLQDLAEEAQISATYLSRLLKQEIGVSFIDYLTRVRVQKAIQLMNDPVLKLYEVADKVGYSSQHYFSTAFKKVLGVSPAEYRKGGLDA